MFVRESPHYFSFCRRPESNTGKIIYWQICACVCNQAYSFAPWVFYRREGLNRFSLKTCELWLYCCWRHSRHFFVLIIFFFSNPMAGFYSTSYLWYCAIGWFVTMLIGTVTSLLLGERQIKQVWVVCEPCSQDLPWGTAFETTPCQCCCVYDR